MTSDLDQTKKAPTVDELIDSRFEQVALAFNQQFEQMYKDFNLTLDKQFKDVRRVEISFANTVNLLFGLVNDQKVQINALKQVLEKGGLSLEEVEDEYEQQKKILIESGEWQEHSMDKTIWTTAWSTD
jgi:hypothetical protein